MPRFELSPTPFDTATLRARLLDARVGAYASFEGWVRDHNEGRSVHGLRYEAYEALALREGEAILAETLARFDILDAACVHRTGDLAIGELSGWVGARGPGAATWRPRRWGCAGATRPSRRRWPGSTSSLPPACIAPATWPSARSRSGWA